MRHWLAVVTFVVLACAAPSASASKCLPSTFEQRFTAADVVFVGTARGIDAELATTFDVERVYKGSVPARVVVHTGGVKYAMLAPPWRFLVYATLQVSTSQPGELELYVQTCGGSERVDGAAEDLARLGEGEPAGLPGSKLVSGNRDGPTASPLEVAPELDAGGTLDAADEAASPLPPAADASSSVHSSRPTRSHAGAAPRDGTRPPAPVHPDAGCAACSVGGGSSTPVAAAWAWAALALAFAWRKRREPERMG